jgi:hypothetical protein
VLPLDELIDVLPLNGHLAAETAIDLDNGPLQQIAWPS